MKCAVIGLGYIGLLEARCLVEKGMEVFGIDTNLHVVESLRNERSHIVGVDDACLSNMLSEGKFHVCVSYTVVANCDTILICVPTPLNQEGAPDLSMIIDCAEQLALHIRCGQLIILESTSYPGTTKDLLQPLLEKSGLKAGVDFLLAFSPERIDPGNTTFSFASTPKLVGGVNERSTQAAERFYCAVLDAQVVPVRNCETAEMAKMLENTYRYINIAFINEMSALCRKMGLNTQEVIRAAGTKPYGFSIFYPNLGIGGHCIAVDPLYLKWVAERNKVELKLVNASEAALKTFFEQVVADILAKISFITARKPRLLLIGVTYKDHVADLRESPALMLIKNLEDHNCEVQYYDELVEQFIMNGKTYQSIAQISFDTVREADMVINNTRQTADILNCLRDYAGQIYDFRGIFMEELSMERYYTL